MITRLEERLANLARICTYGEYTDIIENGKLSEEYKEYYDIFKFLKDTELYCNPYTKEMVNHAADFIEKVKDIAEDKYSELKVLTNLSICSIIYLQVGVGRLISHDGTLNSVKTSVPQV